MNTIELSQNLLFYTMKDLRLPYVMSARKKLFWKCFCVSYYRTQLLQKNAFYFISTITDFAQRLP